MLALCLLAGATPVLAFSPEDPVPVEPPELVVEYEAKIGDTNYKTLEAALTAVTTENNVITLLQDVTLEATLNIDETVTIEGGGNMISGASGAPVITVGGSGEATVKDVSLAGGSAGFAVDGTSANLSIGSGVSSEAVEVQLQNNALASQVTAAGLIPVSKAAGGSYTGYMTSDIAKVGTASTSIEGTLYAFDTPADALAHEGATAVFLNKDWSGDVPVPEGVSFTVNENVVLTGNIANSGVVINNGTVSGNITGAGAVQNSGTIVGTTAGTVTQKVTFTGMPAGATVQVYFGNEWITATDGVIYLTAGTHSYQVTASGYTSASGTVTVADAPVAVPVSMQYIPTSWIYVESPAHGEIGLSSYTAAQGAWVDFTVKADVGYRLYYISVKTSAGADVTVYHVGGNVYRFQMPGTMVSISASFIRTVTPFVDLALADWYYEAASFAYWNGLMDGVSSYQFAPDAATTRAMAVTVIYRLAGAPYVSGESGFSDVPGEAWYARAVKWAADKGIVNGRSATSFAPDEAVTREEFAAMLYRYARSCGYYTGNTGSGVQGYLDAGKISGYAYDALQWACGRGIVDGVGAGFLSPQGGATRAQLATMIYRFCQDYII